ncbi:MAG: type II secretion system F family protein [Desulfobacteraceae bacterium]|nr:type II secretion system F family protein [Desulfobacteraceae bacterium]
MAVYEYQALTKNGKNKKGIIDAGSPETAKAKIRDKNLYPVSLKEVKSEKNSNQPSSILNSFLKPKIKTKEIALATRQISTLLSARFHLVAALESVSNQIKSDRLKTILTKVKDEVESGKSFAEALSGYPDVFTSIYINMIKAAEAAGTLEIVMERIADLMETSEKRKSKIRAALAYPVLMMFFGIIVLIILMTMIVPKIVSIFSDMNQQLPAITIFLIAASEFLKKSWWILMVLIVLFPGFLRYLFKNDKTGYFMDSLVIKIPLFGELNKKLIAARFSRILSSLVKYDVPILKSLDIVINIVENRIFKDALLRTKNGVERGEGLAYSLEREKIFPEITTQMISVGEKSGNLEDMLAKVADIYESETEDLIVALTSMLEPLIIVFMAVVIGFIVFAICIPIFTMNQMIG